jgi:hypothetical protein
MPTILVGYSDRLLLRWESGKDGAPGRKEALEGLHLQWLATGSFVGGCTDVFRGLGYIKAGFVNHNVAGQGLTWPGLQN